jgi:predicted Fe-Mo cluster-binding NifX family protein
MKIAVPVYDDSLKLFDNAGHSPYFGVFSVSGSGMFAQTSLEELRQNPRDDIDHECESEHGHSCDHDHDDEEHVKKHDLLASKLSDCDYIVVKRACKNTMLGLQRAGVKVKKYNGDGSDANQIVAQVRSELS